MKQFIISEQEKSRILEMHQDATSRQYLMEQYVATSKNNSVIITLPYKKIKDQMGNIVEVPATEAFSKPEYVPTFLVLDGDPDLAKELSKNPNMKTYTLNSINLGGGAGEGIITTFGTQKFVKGGDGYIYLSGRASMGGATKIKFGIFPSGNATKFSDTTTQRMGGVQIKKGKEYIPTQK
jgi:hypothetical protein